MGGSADWVRDLFGWSSPPPRTFQLRPHVPKVPPSAPSRFLPGLQAEAYHRVSDNLRRANELLGCPPGEHRTQRWPARHEWGNELTQARTLRESAFKTVLDDIVDRQPHLQPFAKRLRYAPEEFPRGSDTRGQTGGWIDDPRNPPFTRLNDTAFSDVYNLHRTVRHELWHQIQRARPQVYRGSESLRDFDAHLRDLENRHTFRLSPEEKFISLREGYTHLQKLKQEPYWNQLQQVQRDSFVERFENQRRDVCHELRDTEFRTTPEYSRICGPQMDPLQQSLNRLWGPQIFRR